MAFCSWSGGKESALSLYRASKSGVEISCLVNMASEDGKRSRSHGVISELINSQAEAIGIPIVQRKTTWESYEEEFKKTTSELRRKGIHVGVFGDIDLKEHRDWIERVCSETGIKPVLPLWEETRKELLLEFIDKGFQAIIVAIHSDFFDPEWLGRKIDRQFILELEKVERIDLCGEHGEYHTFVYDGPIFKKPVEFQIGEKRLREKHWFLELRPPHLSEQFDNN